MAKPQSAASYIIQQKRAAMDAGQARPSSKALLQQYKSMNTAPVQQVTGMGPPPSFGPAQGGPISAGPGAPIPQPAGATSTFQGGATGGMGGGMPSATGTPNSSLLPTGAMFKKGGGVKAKKMASGGMTSKVSSASKRADGIATRGKTKCKMY